MYNHLTVYIQQSTNILCFNSMVYFIHTILFNITPVVLFYLTIVSFISPFKSVTMTYNPFNHM